MKRMAISFMLCIHECAFQAMSTSKCLQCYKINLIRLKYYFPQTYILGLLGLDRVVQSTNQHIVRKKFLPF